MPLSIAPVNDARIEIPPSEKEMISDFYHRTISRFAGEHLRGMKEEIRFIVVGHLVPTLPFYLEALNKIGTIAAVIQKGSVPDEKVDAWLRDWLKKTGDGIIVDKEYFANRKDALIESIQSLSVEEKARLRIPLSEEGGAIQADRLGNRELLALNGPELIKEWVQEKKGIIIDIGGYFALCLQQAKECKVIGIVEDTENGHQLYESELHRLHEIENKRRLAKLREFYEIATDKLSKSDGDQKTEHVYKSALLQHYQAVFESAEAENSTIPPIITVARSQIKDSEDYNVGKAIVDATDHILRTADYTHLAESKTILIIGYGKIGSAAARVAAEKTRGPVLICEKDHVRRLKASSHSFRVVELEEGLELADVIISCTGNKCLEVVHLKMIKNNVYISSCTSRDGEFGAEFLASLNVKPQQENGKHITRYTIAGKTINLLNDGNSVNFVEKAVHGYFIHGVLASLATAATRIYLESSTELEEAKPLKTGILNDFNDLALSDGLSYQSVIADILMREKLRTAPLLTNYQRSSARYLPKDEKVRELKLALNEDGRVHIKGGKKYGKSQIVEEFYALHGSRYDIVWQFDASSLLEVQIREFAEKIDAHPGIRSKTNERGFAALISERINGTPAKRDQNIRAKREQIRAERKSFFKKLQDADLSYLFIFEDMDILVEEKELDQNDFAEMMPVLSDRKREHIIVTSGDQSECFKNYREIQLKPFPALDLFKFLINNDAVWASKEKKLGALAYAFVHPHSSDNSYMGGPIEHQEEGYEIFVAISNIFAAFIKKHPHYDWTTFIPKTEIPDGGHIQYFFSLLLKELSIAAKKVLFLFYALDFKKTICFLDAAAVENFSEKKVIWSKDLVKELDEDPLEILKEYGLIEEDEDDFISPVLPLLSADSTVNKLRNVIEKSLLDDNVHKEELKEYKDSCKKLIVSSTVKLFCHDDEITVLTMLEEIEKATQEEFYIQWKKDNGPLYAKLLTRLGDHYTNNSTNVDVATSYYEKAKKQLEALQNDPIDLQSKIKKIESKLEAIRKSPQKNSRTSSRPIPLSMPSLSTLSPSQASTSMDIDDTSSTPPLGESYSSAAISNATNSTLSMTSLQGADADVGSEVSSRGMKRSFSMRAEVLEGKDSGRSSKIAKSSSGNKK